MLSLSADQNKTDVDLNIVTDDEIHDDGGVPFGFQLVKFAESVANGDETALASSRRALLDIAGPAVLVDAAGVAANFQRMVRIADATAIPVDKVTVAISKNVREELDLSNYHSAQNTPPPTFIQRLQGVFIRTVAPFFIKRMANKDKA